MTGDRWVTLICTGHGRGGHPKKRLDRVTLRDGEARSLEESRHRLRRAFTESQAGRPAPDFDLWCTVCHRGPQATRARMTSLVNAWLENEPDRRSVVRDVSDPAIARWF